MRRIALFAAAAVAVAITATAVWLLWSLDARVARAIEAHGAELLGTPVDVDSVDIDLAAGKGVIRGIHVANPKGFSRGDAIALEQISIAIEARSLTQQPFQVESVRVGNSTVRFEIGEHGGSNIEQFAHHLAKHPSGADESSAEPRRFSVGDLAFAGGAIVLSVPDAEDERIELPDMQLEHLGGERGATGGELGAQIARAFTRRVVAATAGHQLGRVVEKKLGETAGDVAERILRDVLD
jgi:hypothetical protein